MTNEERDAFFATKSKAIINELVGNVEYPVVDHTYRTIDKNWYKNRSFYDCPRLHDPMNSDTKGVREYQEQIHENGGYVYSEIKPKPLIET